MGKASKWIRNFLIGKREDNERKSHPSIQPESTYILDSPVAILPANTPKVKRRWSFKRSTSNTRVMTHKTNKSLDSILTPKQVLLVEYESEQNLVMHLPSNANAHAAATKIQALYRSYLARRALRALRALVKLQALVRGHMVRKQMTSVVRSMHAVMTIQVRARIHRVQMADEPPVLVGRRKSYKQSSAHDSQLRKEIGENTSDGNAHQTRGVLGSGSGCIDHTLAERLEYGSNTSNYGRLSVSQREYIPKTCPTPSALSFTDSSSSTFDDQQEEYSLKMAPTSSKYYSVCPENKQPFIHPIAHSPDYITSGPCFIPNYMNNTKSSKAKARSDSEPRRRPKLGTKQKSRRSSSIDWKFDKNQYPWLIKIYQSDKFTYDRDYDSNISAMTSISNHRESLIPFEPGMNLKRK